MNRYHDDLATGMPRREARARAKARAMAKMNTHVWVFDAEATGPEGGDYDGRQSAHATKDSALVALFDFIHGLGVDPRDTSATVADTTEYKDDQGEVWQVCGTVETINGWDAHYGVRRTEVRP